MPMQGGNSDKRGRLILEKAKEQVRKKFPDLPEGSSGWHRAIENRIRRIKEV